MSATKMVSIIPADLTELNQWICWWAVVGTGERVQLPGGHWTKEPLPIHKKAHKIPINPLNGNHASTTNPNTWGSLIESRDGVERWHVTGIGWVVTIDSHLVLIDIDECRDAVSGEIAPWALDMVKAIDSYTEISPSGTGLHIWAYGEKPAHGCKTTYQTGVVEMYVTARYLTVTEMHLSGTPTTIEKRPSEILATHLMVFGPPEPPPANRVNYEPLYISDEDLLQRIRRSRSAPKFDRLWAGDTSDFGGDESGADLALCDMLAFWTGRASDQMDRLFRQSGLMRDKWESGRRDSTYGSNTIQLAIAGCVEVWTPPRSYRNGTANGSPASHLHDQERESEQQQQEQEPESLELPPEPEPEPEPEPVTVSVSEPETADLSGHPAPLGKAAFYGLAGEFVRIVEPETEADPASLLLQFYVASGIFFGRQAYCEVGATRHHANLFAVICGPTSQGRKGSAWDHVKACFRRVDDQFVKNCITSGLASGEGLISAVRDPIKEIKFTRAHPEGVLLVTDPGVEDKRLCVVEGEFSRPLKVATGQTNILSPVMRSAWDSGDMSNLTKNNRFKATGAHVGIIGHITKEEVVKLLTNTEVANGFGNRFLWAWSRRSRSLPDGGKLPDDALDCIREGLLVAEGNIYSGQPALCRDADASAFWRSVYEDLSTGQPGLVGALIGRAAPQVLRLSLIAALLDCSRSIRLPHLEAALEIWRYCRESAAFTFGDSLGNETADEILRFLFTVGAEGATRTDISVKLFGRNKTSDEIKIALAALLQYRRARFETEPLKEGRPVERWFACRR